MKAKERNMCLIWWFIILGLATFWTLMAILAFGNDEQIIRDFINTPPSSGRQPFDSWLNSEDSSRVGEIYIDHNSERMIIYDEYRQNRQEYQLRDLGNGVIRVEPR